MFKIMKYCWRMAKEVYPDTKEIFDRIGEANYLYTEYLDMKRETPVFATQHNMFDYDYFKMGLLEYLRKKSIW